MEPVQVQNAFVHSFGLIGEVVTSRMVYTVTKKGNRHRRVVLIGGQRLFVVDLSGLVRRVVFLDDIEGGFRNENDVLLQMKQYRTDPSLYVEELDVPENNKMPDILTIITHLKPAFEVTRSTTPLSEIAHFKKGEGYNSPMALISKVYPRTGLPPSPPEHELQGILERQMSENKRLSFENDVLRKQMTPRTPVLSEVKELQDRALGLQEPRYVFVPTEEYVNLPPSPRVREAVEMYEDALRKVHASSTERTESTAAYLKSYLQQTRAELENMRSHLSQYEQQNVNIARVLAAAAIPSALPEPPPRLRDQPQWDLDDAYCYPSEHSHESDHPRQHEVDVQNAEMLQTLLDMS